MVMRYKPQKNMNRFMLFCGFSARYEITAYQQLFGIGIVLITSKNDASISRMWLRAIIAPQTIFCRQKE